MNKNCWTIKIKIFWVACLTGLLGGCGPQFVTKYSYEPPSTAEGRICAMQCENSRAQCVQLVDMERQNCEIREQQRRLAYDLCVSQSNKKAKETGCYMQYEFCGGGWEARERCTAPYNSCYAVCGGQVSSQTVCVSNCD